MEAKPEKIMANNAINAAAAEARHTKLEELITTSFHKTEKFNLIVQTLKPAVRHPMPVPLFLNHPYLQ